MGMFTIENDWITESGLRAVCVMSSMGHRCGYVGIGKDHPLFGVDYSAESECLSQMWEKAQEGPIGKRGIIPLVCGGGKARPDCVFDVHGGLTYSGGRGYPVGDENTWWFGFDCAHAGDAAGYGRLYYPGDVFRSQAYVEAECESLARQLAEVQNANLALVDGEMQP